MAPPINVMTNPADEIRMPGDTPGGMGNCGVVAIATFTGKPYQMVESWIRHHCRKPGNWKGSTRYSDQKAALRVFNRKRSAAFNVKRRMTLKTWVSREMQPGVTYMIWTTAHLQVVRDGFVTDQSGTWPISQYWGKGKAVRGGIARKS